MNITIRQVVEIGDKRAEIEITVTDVQEISFTLAHLAKFLKQTEEPK